MQGMNVNEQVYSYSHVPYGPSGQGNFGANLLKMNKQILLEIQEDVIAHVQRVPFVKDEIFHIGDYGCADGATSMELIQEMLTCLRAIHGADTQFQITYEDQAINDYNSLFKRLSGLIPNPRSYVLDMDSVFVFGCGTSFYRQCVPSKSMHVIVSFLAVQWLSKRPTSFQKSFYLTPDSSEKEKQLLLQQAKCDWEQFLLMRSKELKSGGLLIVSAPSQEASQGNEDLKMDLQIFLKTASSKWKYFQETGRITLSEFINTNMDTCYYNTNQLKEPFENMESEVYKSGLRLMWATSQHIPNTIYLSWKKRLEEYGIDDRKTLAKEYTNACRCFSNSVFMSGLSSSRGLEEKTAIVDELFQQVEDAILLQNPQDFEDDIFVSFAFMYKV